MHHETSNYQPDSSNYQPDSSNYQLQADNPADNPAASFVVYMHVTPEDKARCVRDYARSIASGADFGRLSGMRNLGLPVDVSTLERLLLGEARCHQVIFKLSAVKGGQVLETRRKARPG